MNEDACIACNRSSDLVPLLTVEFRGQQMRICAQHLPILIHDPEQLIGKFEGAETLKPSEHRD